MKKFFKTFLSSTLALLIVMAVAVPSFLAVQSETQGNGTTIYYDSLLDSNSANYGKSIDLSINGSAITWGPTNVSTPNGYENRTSKYIINGRSAICAWAGALGPSEEKNYGRLTKYVLTNSDRRAKAFYWHIINPNATITNSSAKWGNASTYKDNLTNTIASLSSTPYDDADHFGLTHAIIDRLQQDEYPSWTTSEWDNMISTLLSKITNYPDVPATSRVFYVYPTGKSNQSIMSIEEYKGYAKITKQSSDSTALRYSGYSLQGAVYGIYASDADARNDRNRITTITTDSSGVGYALLQHNGESGHVWAAKEITPSKGFGLDQTIYHLAVGPGNDTQGRAYRVTSTEPALQGHIQIHKTSADPSLTENNSNYSLEGAVYGIYGTEADAINDQNRFDTLTTTASGESNVSTALYFGTYCVKEITAPRGFDVDESVYTVTLNSTHTQASPYILNVQDVPNGAGQIKILKSSANPDITDGSFCYNLEGTTYRVYDNQADAEALSDNFVDEIVIDEHGIGYSKALYPATYWLRESVAGQGYFIDEEVYWATVGIDETVEVELTDMPGNDPVTVFLKKVDEQTGEVGRRLEGAEFTVRYYDAFYTTEEECLVNAPTREWVLSTNSNGFCMLSDEFKVSGDEFYYDLNSQNPILPLGTVYIFESKAPDGYKLAVNPYVEQITMDGEGLPGNVNYNAPEIREPRAGVVNISGTKVWRDDNDRDGLRPDTLTITLRRDGEIYDTYTTDESQNWHFEFNDLPEGYGDLFYDNDENIHYYTYTVEEETISGYSSTGGSLTEVSSTTDDYNVTTHNYECEFINIHEPERIRIDGTKTWDDYDDVFGFRPSEITITLLMNGTPYRVEHTDESKNWTYEFTNLYKYYNHGQAVTYTIQEEAIDHYTATYDGYDILNTLNKGSIRLYKTDETGLELQSGVGFKLFTADGREIVSTQSGRNYSFTGFGLCDYVTNDRGYVRVNGLPAGDYYFIETDSLDGYMPYPDPIPFTLEENENGEISVASQIAENHRAVLYETGGVGNIIFYAVAGATAAAAIVLLSIYFIRKKKKEQK